MYTLFFDGCSKGNPGHGGAGAVIYDEYQTEIISAMTYVGDYVTNNVSEYTGLISGLEQAIRRGIKELIVKGDSLLVIRQMNGEYKVNASNLIPLHKKAKELASTFTIIIFQHVYREDNQRADKLSNEALNIK